MMTNPIISVVVPVYNAAPYLRRCLDSLLAQTHTGLEVLLADDGSTDDSLRICREYAEKDSRFRLLQLSHGGVAKARNACLDAATGDYIAFLDSDDWLEPDTYAFMLSLAREHGADLVQVGLTMECSWGSFLRNRQSQPVIPIRREDFSTEEQWHILSNETANKLFRRFVLEGLRFDSRFAIAEDMLLVMQAVERTEAMVFCEAGKYHYRQHADSSYNSWTKPKCWEDMWRAYRIAEERYADLPGARERFRTVLVWCTLDICRGIATRYRPEHAETCKAIRRSVRGSLAMLRSAHRIPPADRFRLSLLACSWTLYRMSLIPWGAGLRRCAALPKRIARKLFRLVFPKKEKQPQSPV